MNQKKTELAKVFRPRSRAGRKTKAAISDDIPNVGNEVEVINAADNPALPEAGCSWPERAASIRHAGIGKFTPINFSDFSTSTLLI